MPEIRLNISGVTMWCGLSPRGLITPLLFAGTATGAAYLNLLQESAVPGIHEDFHDGDFDFQRDGAPPHYHREVRAYLNENLPNRWIARRDYPACSPDPTPLDCFLWGFLKDKVHAEKPETIDEIRVAIERECVQITDEMIL